MYPKITLETPTQGCAGLVVGQVHHVRDHPGDLASVQVGNVDRLLVQEPVELAVLERHGIAMSRMWVIEHLAQQVGHNDQRSLHELAVGPHLHALLLAVHELQGPRLLVKLVEHVANPQVKVVVHFVVSKLGQDDLTDVDQLAVHGHVVAGELEVLDQACECIGVRDLSAGQVLALGSVHLGAIRVLGKPLVVVGVVKQSRLDLACGPAERGVAACAEHLVAARHLEDGGVALGTRPCLGHNGHDTLDHVLVTSALVQDAPALVTVHRRADAAAVVLAHKAAALVLRALELG